MARTRSNKFLSSQRPFAGTLSFPASFASPRMFTQYVRMLLGRQLVQAFFNLANMLQPF
jgi:hypothetical protein